MKVALAILVGLSGTNKVITAISDERHHEYFDHPSGMRAFITESPHAKVCSAALRVAVGSLQNPKEFLGLAHFLEHALFLGSGKYPNPKHFNEFLGKNGGSANAYTSSFETVFYFKVNCPQFHEALDIFAQMFIDPLLNEETALGELNQINDEFCKNIQNQIWRKYEVIKSLANPATSFNSFATGNNATLRLPGVVEAVRKFFQHHYHPSRYVLAVYGPEREALKKSIQSAFQGLKADSVTPLAAPPDDFYTTNQLGKLIKIDSLHAEPKLAIELFFKGNLYKMPTRPLILLDNYMKSYHAGSLLHTLEARGWATEIVVEGEDLGGIQTHASVIISLTALGREKYMEVARYFFAYADSILQGLDESFYEAVREMKKIDFDYYSVEDSLDLVDKIVNAASLYPPERVLSGLYEMSPFSSRELDDVLSQIAPRKALVVLSAQNLEALNLKAEYYGTIYSVEPLDLGHSGEAVSGLALPPPLLFRISSKELMALRQPPQKEKGFDPIEPEDLTPEEGVQAGRLLYHRDERFGLPVYQSFFYLYLDQRNTTGADKEAALVLIDSLFEQESRLLAFQLDMTRTTFTLSRTMDSIVFELSGPSPLFGTACATAFEFIKNFFTATPTKKDFDIKRTKLIQVNLDVRQDFLYKYANKASMWAISATRASSEEIDAAYRAMTYEGFLDFFQSFKTEAFLEVLVAGSVPSSAAVSVFSLAQAALQTRRTINFTPPEEPLRNLRPSGGLMLPSPNPASDNSIVHLDYYLGPRYRVAAFAYILNTAIASDFFDDLRTSQQSGYVVYAAPLRASGHVFFRFAVQSGKITSTESLKRIDIFVNAKVKALEGLSAQLFDSIKEAAKGTFLQPFESFDRQSEYLKGQMRNHDGRFDDQWRMPVRIDRMKLKTFQKMATELFIVRPRRLHFHLVAEKDYADTRRSLESYTAAKGESLHFSYADYAQGRAQLRDLTAVAQEL